ncbi:uncharacterized protein LOC111519052 isoform X2 [Drosophila willistoni]|uniref:uncharacterized protein LOC111519052 isoform X2 n=1 Tax=Drosophila willistoni TaxID=7260 RepID=UPI001F07DA06|nr:uncharacterized protein LOC111519052 isoform X2 [Drosophila willistoni]
MHHHRQLLRQNNKALILNSKCVCGAMRNYLDSFLVPNSKKGSSILWYLDNIFNDIQCCSDGRKHEKTPDELAYAICCKPRKRRKPKKVKEIDTLPIPNAPWTPLTGSGLMCGKSLPKRSPVVIRPQTKINQEVPAQGAMEGRLAMRRRSIPRTLQTPTWLLDQDRKSKDEAEAKKLRQEEEEKQKYLRKLEAMVRFKLFREINQKINLLRNKRMSLSDRVPTPYRRSVDLKSLSDLKEKKQQWSENLEEKFLLHTFTPTIEKKKQSKKKTIDRSLRTPFGIYDFMERSHRPNFSYRFSKMLRQEAAVVPEFHPNLKSRYALQGEHPRQVTQREYSEKIGDTLKNIESVGKQKPGLSFRELLKDIEQPKDHPILKSRYEMPTDKHKKRKVTSKSKTSAKPQQKSTKSHDEGFGIPLDNLLGLQKSQLKIRPKFTHRFSKMLHGKTALKPESHPNFRSMYDMSGINEPLKTIKDTVSKTMLHKTQSSIQRMHKMPSISSHFKHKDEIKKHHMARSSKIISGLPAHKRQLRRVRNSMQSTGSVSQDIDQISMIGDALDWEPPLRLRRNKPGIPKMQMHRLKSKTYSKTHLARETILSDSKEEGALSQLPVPKFPRLGAHNTYAEYKPDLILPYQTYSNPSMSTTGSVPLQFSNFRRPFRYKAPDLTYAPRAKPKDHGLDVKKSSMKVNGIKPKSTQEEDNISIGVGIKLRKFSSYIKNSLPDRMIVKRIGSKTSIAYLRSNKKPTKNELDNVSLISLQKSGDSGMLISSSDILKTSAPQPPSPPATTIKNKPEEVEFMFAPDACTPLSSDAGTRSSRESFTYTTSTVHSKIKKAPTKIVPVPPSLASIQNLKDNPKGQNSKRKRKITRYPRVHIKEQSTYSETENDNASKHSSRSAVSMDEVAKEIDELEARARERQSLRCTKQSLREKFTMEEHEKLNEKIRQYIEQCAIREDHQFKKPPRDFVAEGKKTSLTPPLKRSKKAKIPVKINHDKFPTVLEILRITDLSNIKLPSITEELYKHWTNDYPTDWTYPLLEPLKIRRYVRDSSSFLAPSPCLVVEEECVALEQSPMIQKTVEQSSLDKCGNNCYCSVCDFFKIAYEKKMAKIGTHGL